MVETKINLNVRPENEVERQIEDCLNKLKVSSEVEELLNILREKGNELNVIKCKTRIKEPKSAIRTFRKNEWKEMKEANDYIGVSYIVNTEEDIYRVVKMLEEIFPNAEFINFTGEESIYDPLVYVKRVPPMHYHVLARKTFEDNIEAPIEIRVSTKEGNISEQAVYYTIYKNDECNIPAEDKMKLRNIGQHIAYKMAILSMRDLPDKEKERQKQEIDNILIENRDFLGKYKKILKDVVKECCKLINEYDIINCMCEKETEDFERVTDRINDKVVEGDRI